jgi:actin-related protein 6
LTLDNLRIAVPELIFRPSDAGLTQSGLAEAVVNCIEKVPKAVAPLLLNNIVLTGGTAQLPNLLQRL